MSKSERLIDALKAFRDERDWAEFHIPKDLALGHSIEAAELNELFLWKGPDEADPDRIAEELVDVFASLLLDRYDLDLKDIVRTKSRSTARTTRRAGTRERGETPLRHAAPLPSRAAARQVSSALHESGTGDVFVPSPRAFDS